MDICLKRAYESASPEDGARFLVDRLWPRGVKKDRLELAAWLKEVAPSSELRRWFGHDPNHWESFANRYRNELRANEEVLVPLRLAARRGRVTLVYSARDKAHNQAVVLRDYLVETTERSAD